MATGKFITFEGGEGSGKSTQARQLAETLRRRGIEVVLTREPGGTPRAERIRDLLFDRSLAGGSPLYEALLFNAARAEHLEGLIRPALARNAWVICDRFMDSTRAYQGAGGHADTASLMTLERMVVGDTVPDLTLILDLAPEVGLERARARQSRETPGVTERDPFEAREHAFHTRLREAYLAIAAANTGRCVVLNAAREIEAIAEDVRRTVSVRFAMGRL
jgi:dTMP kinase